MSRSRDRVRRLPGFIGIALLTACAPSMPSATGPGPPSVTPPAALGIPPIPSIDGSLAISIVHPTAGVFRPRVDSTFIYGSVGTGSAELTINGIPVDVAPNGAFLGYLPMPPDGTFWLAARAGSDFVEASLSYREPPTPAPATAPATVDYPRPRSARVTGGADTLATGSDVVVGRSTPAGAYRWFLPRGARLLLTGERGDMVRAQLDEGTVAWFPRTSVGDVDDAPPLPSLEAPVLLAGADWSDIRIAVEGAPFRVESADTLLSVILHGVVARTTRVAGGTDAVVSFVEQASMAADAAILRIHPRERIWGYRAFYEPDGTLVVRLRRPPRIDPADPLRGIRILVDPGHPPGGATGPTGLTEAAANLAIASRLEEQLRSRGAEVLMTRTTDAELALGRRVQMADEWGAEVLISIHNNAFPEGVNPFRRNGTSTYYFHSFSEPLARAMNAEIVATSLVRDLGALQGNLALVRPTWMPSVLTESLFMPIPENEAALRDPAFLEALAAAHLRGLERFLLGGTDRLTRSAHAP